MVVVFRTVTVIKNDDSCLQKQDFKFQSKLCLIPCVLDFILQLDTWQSGGSFTREAGRLEESSRSGWQGSCERCEAGRNCNRLVDFDFWKKKKFWFKKPEDFTVQFVSMIVKTLRFTEAA